MNRDLSDELKIIKLTKTFYPKHAQSKKAWYRVMEKTREVFEETKMNKEIPNYRIDTPEMVSHVSVKGEWIPLSSVQFLNIEEDMQGKDVITFGYKDAIWKSHVVFRPE